MLLPLYLSRLSHSLASALLYMRPNKQEVEQTMYAFEQTSFAYAFFGLILTNMYLVFAQFGTGSV